MKKPSHLERYSERGTSLAELMIALVILSVGLLAVAQIFPAGSRSQIEDRMLTAGTYYAQEKVEQLVLLKWTDTALDLGTHPTTPESLGPTGAWQRSYLVEQLDPPLSNLKRITVTVTWTYQGARSVGATTYLRR